MIETIKQKARELLQSQAVACVIGYERATDGISARPLFCYAQEDVDRMIFDETCVHNLAKYLLNKKDKVTGIVVKPCDARAINLLLNEKQIQRDKVYLIGVVCTGVVDSRWGVASKDLQASCQLCAQHTPPIYDFLVGEPVAEKELPASYQDVLEQEAKSLAERRGFWSEQFNRCIRCYACRQVCPGCYCTECFVDRLDPQWVGIKMGPAENWMWNTGRAYHLTGRCIDCGECQRVCPMHLPLMLLNHKLSQEVQSLFQFTPGMSAETDPPLVTFKKEEDLGVG